MSLPRPLLRVSGPFRRSSNLDVTPTPPAPASQGRRDRLPHLIGCRLAGALFTSHHGPMKLAPSNSNGRNRYFPSGHSYSDRSAGVVQNRASVVRNCAFVVQQQFCAVTSISQALVITTCSDYPGSRIHKGVVGDWGQEGRRSPSKSTKRRHFFRGHRGSGRVVRACPRLLTAGHLFERVADDIPRPESYVEHTSWRPGDLDGGLGRKTTSVPS